MSAHRTRFVLTTLAAVVLVVAACSGSDLPESLRGPLTERVSVLAADASVPLDAEQADCVVLALPLEVGERLAAQSTRDSVSPEDAESVSEAILDCVGEDVIGRAALLAQAGGLRESSLDCAAAELDRLFLVRLVAAEMTDTGAVSSEVELQVATAFGLCMETDEFLNR